MSSTILYLLLLIVNPNKKVSLSDRLCAPNEQIIISFRTITKKKTVSLCADTTGKYLVYRFGTKDHIELQFPSKLDASSWKQFHYRGEWRFGGKANAGFGDLKISFKNIDTEYKIFESWNDEDNSKERGLDIGPPYTKAKRLLIDRTSVIGTLMRLNDYKAIENEADSE